MFLVSKRVNKDAQGLTVVAKQFGGNIPRSDYSRIAVRQCIMEFDNEEFIDSGRTLSSGEKWN